MNAMNATHKAHKESRRKAKLAAQLKNISQQISEHGVSAPLQSRAAAIHRRLQTA